MKFFNSQATSKATSKASSIVKMFPVKKLLEHYKSNSYPKLESKRLILRKPTKYDTSAFHQILSAPNISRYSDLPVNATVKKTKHFLSWMSKLYSRESGIAWLICLKNNNTVIGAIRVYKIEKKALCGLLAYEIHPDHWQQGFATEALTQVINYAHNELKLNRLEAWSHVNNIASDHVLNKNGFTLEGRLHEKVCVHGKLEDVNLFARLAHSNNNA